MNWKTVGWGGRWLGPRRTSAGNAAVLRMTQFAPRAEQTTGDAALSLNESRPAGAFWSFPCGSLGILNLLNLVLMLNPTYTRRALIELVKSIRGHQPKM